MVVFRSKIQACINLGAHNLKLPRASKILKTALPTAYKEEGAKKVKNEEKYLLKYNMGNRALNKCILQISKKCLEPTRTLNYSKT